MKRPRSSFLTVSVPVVLFIFIVTIVAVGLYRSDPAARSAAPSVQENPTDQWVPTPVPTVILSPIPPATPPAPGAEETEEALRYLSLTITPQPAPDPSDPCIITVLADSMVITDTVFLTERATIVAIGTVTQVMPARWTTSDGKRPENPCASDNSHSIFRPVFIEVGQYLKGQQTQTELPLAARGGVIDQDSLEYTYNRDDFQVGERVLVFLIGPYQMLPNTAPFWSTQGEHYTIAQNGQATNSIRSVTLQQIIDEIHQATVQ